MYRWILTLVPPGMFHGTRMPPSSDLAFNSPYRHNGSKRWEVSVLRFPRISPNLGPLPVKAHNRQQPSSSNRRRRKRSTLWSCAGGRSLTLQPRWFSHPPQDWLRGAPVPEVHPVLGGCPSRSCLLHLAGVTQTPLLRKARPAPCPPRCYAFSPSIVPGWWQCPGDRGDTPASVSMPRPSCPGRPGEMPWPGMPADAMPGWLVPFRPGAKESRPSWPLPSTNPEVWEGRKCLTHSTRLTPDQAKVVRSWRSAPAVIRASLGLCEG